MEFLLDPDVVFLNHGSFGACPVDVFDEYQRLQRRLEAQPVRFVQRERPALLATAREALADEVGCRADSLAYVTNPTFAVNEIARSLDLGPGDEILTTNHEYGACRNVWDHVAEHTGAHVVEVPLPLTVATDADIVEAVRALMTSRTRALFVSHISSPTAMTFPVAELCALARDAGVVSIVDGAHAPGQLQLDLGHVGADFYVGACHKWLCAPKGASFLAVSDLGRGLLRPLVVGWGSGSRRQFDLGSAFLDTHEWLGTHDPSAVLTVPAAIEFQRRHDWPAVRDACHRLLVAGVDAAAMVAGVDAVHEPGRFVQMGLLSLGTSFLPGVDAVDVQRRLRDEWRIEVPVIEWIDTEDRAHRLVRVSVQAYNRPDDLDHLVAALRSLAGEEPPPASE